MSHFKEDLRKIKAFVFDIDGVLSRQTVMIDAEGQPIRSANIRDGYALQLAIRKGWPIAIITGGNSQAMKNRLEILGVKEVYLKSADKKVDFKSFLKKNGLQAGEILYMGDDLPDYEVMRMAGVPVCPADADNEIKQISTYISDKRGGEGCVRDVIEQVLRLHDQWMNHDGFTW